MRWRAVNFVGLGGALLGLVASAVILVEKFWSLTVPDYEASCSFDKVISCSPVMNSPQASVFFGVPNMLFGLVGFTALAVFFGLAVFVELPAWSRWVALAGSGFAVGFSFWLASQALFVIGAICVYCVLVWVASSVVFFSLLRQVGDAWVPGWWGLVCNLGLVVVLFVFALMLFLGFPQYWFGLF